eukprot:3600108-Alexandrium_andersonii.AAC.1
MVINDSGMATNYKHEAHATVQIRPQARPSCPLGASSKGLRGSAEQYEAMTCTIMRCTTMRHI